MACIAADLNVLAYANGFTLWHYRTDDRAESLRHASYFRPAGTLLCTGDLIIASTDGGASGSLLRVARSEPPAVDVDDLLAARGLDRSAGDRTGGDGAGGGRGL